jgi:hypothetical protein
MAQYQHLPIYKKTYDVLLRTMIATKHFPREYKYTVLFLSSLRKRGSRRPRCGADKKGLLFIVVNGFLLDPRFRGDDRKIYGFLNSKGYNSPCAIPTPALARVTSNGNLTVPEH